MTFQRIQKTGSTKTETPRTSHLSSRPFAPIIQHSIPTPLQQPEQIEIRLQRKTNLLEIPLMPPPKKVIQAKLTIGEPGDKYEQEADTVARQVVQRLNVPIPSQTLDLSQPKSEIFQGLKAKIVQQSGRYQQLGIGQGVQAKSSIVQREPSPSPQTLVIAPQGFDNQAPTAPDPSILDEDKQKNITFSPSTAYFELNPDGTVNNGKKIVKEERKKRNIEYDLSNGTEEGYVITFNKTRYWVAKADAIKVREAGFKKVNQPLFSINETTGKPRDPSVNDVIQGNIADCYLMTAIAAIAETNPEYIFTMFRDYEDTVSVRLYDVDESDPANPKFTPRYIKVNKSVAVDVDGDLLYSQGSLWVSMLEKAYAAAGFGGSTEKTSDQSLPPSYQKIENGTADYALSVLLGKPAVDLSLKSGETQESHELVGLPWTQKELNFYKIAQKSKNYAGLQSSRIFKQNVQKIHQWMDWLTKNGQTAIKNLYTQKKMGTYEEEIRLEDLETMFKAEGLDATLITDLIRYLQRYFPGKRGTGKYTSQQLDWYNKIENKLSQKEPMVVGSKKKVGRGKVSQGSVVDEDVSKGLFGSHAYTVIGCEYDQKSGLRYVMLREPHAQISREYDINASKGNKAEANQQADGEFFLELSDLTKRFNHLYTTNEL